MQACAAERPSVTRTRSRERLAVSPWALLLPLAALTVLTSLAYAPYMRDYFVGGDTWAHIWTSRDVGQVLTQPIMEGSGFPETVAHFYRPVSSLSYTLQYALSGLNPLAFHLGDLLFHVLAMLSLAGLAITFGIRPWAAALGAAVVALHPAMASVVPAAPRRHDSLVTIGLCVGLALVVCYVTLRSERQRRKRLALPTLILSCAALAFAELAKEIGFVGLLLVLPISLAACYAAGLSIRSQWRRLAYVVLAWTATSVVLLAWHAHVVGGLGGYGPLSPFTDLDTRVDELVQILLWPLRAYLQTYLKAWLIEASLVVFIAGVPLLLIHRRAAATLFVGWAWLLVSATFQLMSESTAPWQTYVTVVAFGLIIAGIVDGAYSAWRSGLAAVSRIDVSVSALAVAAWPAHSRSWMGVARAVLVACLSGVAVFGAGVVRDSMLLTPYPEWHAAASVAERYLGAIRPCIDAAPAGETVLLANWPNTVDDGTEQYRLIMSGVFAPYSVAPAVYLTMNHPGLSVQAQKSELAISPANRGIQATCSQQGGVWLVDAIYDPPLQQPSAPSRAP
jgi:hypothetical protein